MSTDLRGDAMHAQQLIPGAYDRTTLTHRQSGSMGGLAFGSVNVPIGPSSMDAATIAEREREGGGALSQRRRKVGVQPQAGRTLTGAVCNDRRLTRGHSWLQMLRLARR